MTISVTSIGTASGASGSTLAITVGVGGVPAGALIVATVTDATNKSLPGPFSDTATNAYTKVVDAAVGGGALGSASIIGSMQYVKNCAALVSGNSITYTRPVSGASTAIGAIYATGIDTVAPLDTAVTNINGTSSLSPSVTSGTPGVAGELFVQVLGDASTNTFTQDASWTSPFAIAGSSGSSRVLDGYLVNAGVGTETATLSASGMNSNWSMIIAGFKAATTPIVAAIQQPPWQPPPAQMWIGY